MLEMVISGIFLLAKELPGLIAEAERKGELTKEQADERRREMVETFASNAWKTDEQLAAGDTVEGGNG